MMISHTSMLFLLFLIYTTFLCSLSSSYDIPTQYTSILGPNLDRLPSQDEAILLFQLWKRDHGRVYKDLEEMADKFKIFLSNLEHIAESNAKRKSPSDFLLGLTNFADWSSKEFQETYLNDMVDMKLDDLPSSVPPSLDWRSKGVVTDVKNQGHCATGAIEGINAIATKKLTSLSEQELVDCNTESDGCKGGWPYKAFAWVIKNGGIASEHDYSYNANQGTCEASKISKSATIAKYSSVEQTEKGLLLATVNQPVSACLYATDDFQHYTDGIYDGPNCPVDSTLVNHCVLIVGYDSVNGEDFWIVKNSWGTRWGNKGYGRIKRNTDKKYGVCAINARAYIPIK